MGSDFQMILTTMLSILILIVVVYIIWRLFTDIVAQPKYISPWEPRTYDYRQWWGGRGIPSYPRYPYYPRDRVVY